MNKILFNKAHPTTHWEHGDALLVPFVCSDAKDMRLDEPGFNRTPAENEMAKDILDRVKKALDAAGYVMLNFSFNSWTLTVKRKS